MTLREINDILESTGIPAAYLAFPESEEPELPLISYQIPYTNNFSADGTVYAPINHVQIDLYTKYKDEATEQILENALASFFYNKQSEYLEDEDCYRTIYELEV